MGNVDYDLLYAQREDLIALRSEQSAAVVRGVSPAYGESLGGVIHLLDDLLDEAEASGEWGGVDQSLLAVCPCCGQEPSLHLATEGSPVLTCRRCGAVHCDEISYEDSLKFVKNAWETSGKTGKEVYFDFSWPYQDGSQYRRHGWFNPATGRITQTG